MLNGYAYGSDGASGEGLSVVGGDDSGSLGAVVKGGSLVAGGVVSFGVSGFLVSLPPFVFPGVCEVVSGFVCIGISRLSAVVSGAAVLSGVAVLSGLSVASLISGAELSAVPFAPVPFGSDTNDREESIESELRLQPAKLTQSRIQMKSAVIRFI